MGAFAAWLGDARGADGETVLRHMLQADAPGVQPETTRGEDWALACAPGAPACAIVSADGVHALLAGELSRHGAPRETDPSTVPAADWPERGTGAPPGGRGRFAMIRLDPARGSLRAAVDRFASIPLYHARVPHGVVLGSSPRIVARHPEVGDELSAQALFDYVYATVVPAPHTIYAAVRAMLPGTVLECAAGRHTARRYWTPAFEQAARAPAGAEEAERVRALLRDSVAAELEGAARAGCFLSGGIDSSSVVAMVREITGEAPLAFSIGFDAEGYDELGYARLVAQRFGAQHHEYYVTPADIVELIPRIARAYGQPFGNSSVIPTYHCAALARSHGVSRMIAGDGGDELFGGNERYAAQRVFAHFAGLPAPLQAGLRAWASREGAPGAALPLVRKAASYVRQASMGLPERLDVFNYVNRLGVATLFDRDFVQSVDPGRPLRERRELFRAAHAASDIDRMLALDFKITLGDNDLPKVSVMCAQAGVEVGFPFLREPLVDFSCTLAAGDKVRGARLRHFFKRAMQGVLPREVLAKHKHGFGLPFGIWLNRDPALRECAFDLLAGIEARGFVSRTFLEELRSTRLAQQPRYYGPLAWTLITLEAWLRENAPGAAPLPR